MIDPFDYKEPSCALCGGKDFYYPDKDAPIGRIPVARVIEKLDECYNKNDMVEASRLLFYWQEEAKSLKDLQGELSIVNELLGHLRKINNVEKGLLAIDRALYLINSLDSENSVSSATIYLNIATTLKAFGRSQDALPLFDKAFSIYSKDLEKNKQYLAGFYNNKALTLVDLKEYDSAIECYNLALDNLKFTDRELVDGAITFVNMAHLYDALNNKQKAIDCMFSAFNFLNDEKNEKNGYYAYVLSKCAPSFRQFGYQKIADDFEKLSREIYERT